MHIREFVEADWPQVWPLIEEVITAQETFPFDPHWASRDAHDVWMTRVRG